jgi:hypothetical protein
MSPLWAWSILALVWPRTVELDYDRLKFSFGQHISGVRYKQILAVTRTRFWPVFNGNLRIDYRLSFPFSFLQPVSWTYVRLPENDVEPFIAAVQERLTRNDWVNRPTPLLR